jgi:hypothetical protein
MTKQKRTLLNDKVKRPILYALARKKVAQTPLKSTEEHKANLQAIKDHVPLMKKTLKTIVDRNFPADDMKILSKYNVTREEGCFYLKNTHSDNDQIYVNLKEGSSYYSTSNAISTPFTDTQACTLFIDEMANNGIDTMNYLAYRDNTLGRRVSYNQFCAERDKIEPITKQINAEYGFGGDDTSFTTASSGHYCHNRALSINSEEEKVFTDYKLLIENAEKSANAIIKDRQSVLDDYYALIRSSKYFEQVLEVWGEASEVSEQMGRTIADNAVSVVSTDALERIKQDQLKRSSSEDNDDTAFVVVSNNVRQSTSN